MHDPHVVGLRRRNGCNRKNFYNFSLLESSRNVRADIAVNHHVPHSHHLLHLRPTRAFDLLPQKRCNGLPLTGGRNVMNFSARVFHLCNCKPFKNLSGHRNSCTHLHANAMGTTFCPRKLAAQEGFA